MILRKVTLITIVLVLLPVLTGCAGSQAAIPPATSTPPAAEPSQAATVAQSATPRLVAITETPPPLADEDLSHKEFMFRQFPLDLEARYERPYPAELTRLTVGELQGFHCTNRYVDTYDTDSAGDPILGFYNEDERRIYVLTDKTLISIVAELNRGAEGTQTNVVDITYCETQSRQKIVLYSFGPCGGGCAGMPRIAMIEDSAITTIARPEGFSTSYFTCPYILALDRADNLYYLCWGGDGGGSGAAVFKVNLVSRDQTALFNCTTDGREVTCKEP